MFQVHVLIGTRTDKPEWRAMHPSGSDLPYQWKTHAEAEKAMRLSCDNVYDPQKFGWSAFSLLTFGAESVSM